MPSFLFPQIHVNYVQNFNSLKAYIYSPLIPSKIDIHPQSKLSMQAHATCQK